MDQPGTHGANPIGLLGLGIAQRPKEALMSTGTHLRPGSVRGLSGRAFGRLARSALLAALFTLLGIPPATAQIQQRLDLRVPMRDGVELSANLWLPDGSGPHPTVLVRTPYIKANERYPQLGKQYADRGYAFIVQDARGRGDSDGSFDFFFADAEDGFDTIEWIARQPWSNGRVGMVGGSYLATVQWLAARAGAPNLVCMIPQAPAADYFDELPYIGGAWLMKWSLDWINGTSGRTAQGPVMGATDWEAVYAHRPLITMDDAMGRDMPLYNDFLSHSTRDAYWDRILFKDEDFAAIDLPALVFTGWFDADQPGTMRYWEGMRDHSPGAGKQHIIIGPWDHGQAISGGELSLGDFRFTPESVVDVQAVHMDFFDYCLAGSRSTPERPRARVYVMGSNEWREFDEYPPAEVEPQSLYLSSGARRTPWLETDSSRGTHPAKHRRTGIPTIRRTPFHRTSVGPHRGSTSGRSKDATTSWSTRARYWILPSRSSVRSRQSSMPQPTASTPTSPRSSWMSTPTGALSSSVGGTPLRFAPATGTVSKRRSCSPRDRRKSTASSLGTSGTRSCRVIESGWRSPAAPTPSSHPIRTPETR